MIGRPITLPPSPGTCDRFQELFTRFQAAVEQLDSEKDMCKVPHRCSAQPQSLGLQPYPEKVVRPQKPTPTTFSGGGWRNDTSCQLCFPEAFARQVMHQLLSGRLANLLKKEYKESRVYSSSSSSHPSHPLVQLLVPNPTGAASRPSSRKSPWSGTSSPRRWPRR